MTAEPNEKERIAFLKFARNGALAADKLTSALCALTQRLEEENIIDPNRPSKKQRDAKMRTNAKEFAVPNDAIDKLVNEIHHTNPDAEKIVASLFRDASPRKTKKQTKIETVENE